MGMTRQEKEQALGELQDKLTKAKAALVTNYTGLTVAAVTEIRRKLRDAKVEYKVVKNTLMQRALKGTPREKLGDVFTGPTAVAFKYDDEFGLLGKTAKDLAKKFEKFSVKAAFIQDEVLVGATVVDKVAALPTLAEARAQLLGVINAPAQRLLAQINAPAQNVVGVIQAKSEKKD